MARRLQDCAESRLQGLCFASSNGPGWDQPSRSPRPRSAQAGRRWRLRHLRKCSRTSADKSLHETWSDFTTPRVRSMETSAQHTHTHTRPVSSEHPCMRALETPLEGYSELCASSPAPGVEVGRTCDANCSRHSNTDLRQAGADVWECLQSLISDFGF